VGILDPTFPQVTFNLPVKNTDVKSVGIDFYLTDEYSNSTKAKYYVYQDTKIPIVPGATAPEETSGLGLYQITTIAVGAALGVTLVYTFSSSIARRRKIKSSKKTTKKK